MVKKSIRFRSIFASVCFDDGAGGAKCCKTQRIVLRNRRKCIKFADKTKLTYR